MKTKLVHYEIFIFDLRKMFKIINIHFNTVVCFGHSLFSFKNYIFHAYNLKTCVDEIIIHAYGILFHVNDLIICEHELLICLYDLII